MEEVEKKGQYYLSGGRQETQLAVLGTARTPIYTTTNNTETRTIRHTK